MPRAHAAVAALIALVAVACQRESKVAIECKSAGLTLGDGLLCSIEHQQGGVPVHACWDMNIRCQDGVAGKAHGCGDVRPMATSSVVLPFSAFGGALDKCDAISASDVGGLSLAAVQ